MTKTQATRKPRNERSYRVLRSFKSKSSPNVRHEVRIRLTDDHVYCTCRGYCTHKWCWHMARFFEQTFGVAA